MRSFIYEQIKISACYGYLGQPGGIYTIHPVVRLKPRISQGVYSSSGSARRNKKTDRVKWSVFKPYVISGVLLGFGWLTLFYGFKHTSISSAVIIYNMCPVYVMIFAPLVLKEAISKLQIAVIFTSFLGLFMIVGHNLSEGYGYMGLALSAVSGVLYAAIVLINRSIKVRADNRTATFVQILTAMLVLLPFVLAEGNIFMVAHLEPLAVIYTILLGVLHTGVAYTMFFSLYAHMKSVEIVSYSFLEPLFGIVFSMIFVGETLTFVQVVGGILILGSTYIGEMLRNRKTSEEDSVQCFREKANTIH
jgi:drug/metabolite transporter (DMT)-like permease